jgi:replication factor C large subunit
MAPLPWTRKHAPQRSGEIVGQEKAVEHVTRFLKGFKRGQKPLLLHGPTGTGKTATVYALAEELDLDVIEVNASDTRNKESINSLLGAALHQQSLFFRGKLLLVDEADGLSGSADRGGVQALLALLEGARYPVIITANDIGGEKLKPLKKACEPVEYTPLDPKALLGLLRRVAKKEGMKCDDEALTALSRRSGGDARAALNDLQALSGAKSVSAAELEALGDRERKESMQNALLRVFKTTSAAVALPAFDNMDEDVDQLFLWIDENLPREYSKPADIAKAYDALAEADRFFGRIRRWQHYRFYVYIYNLLTAGIALAKEEKYAGVQEYKRSSRLLTIWIMNQKNAKKRGVAAKLAAKSHASARRAFEDVAYLRPLFKHDKAAAAAITSELGLEAEEAEWLTR